LIQGNEHTFANPLPSPKTEILRRNGARESGRAPIELGKSGRIGEEGQWKEEVQQEKDSAESHASLRGVKRDRHELWSNCLASLSSADIMQLIS
jgi:hypothetical protein